MNSVKQAPWQADALLLLVTALAAGGWIFSKEALAGMPPFGRLAGIILSGGDMAKVFDLGNFLARNDRVLRQVGAEVWGPAPAPIARVKGRHRVRLLVKAEKTAPLQSALAEWAAQLRLPANLRLAIDIDPQSFL